ncbi:hypothetical protein [Streptomyces dangxiongensis]|uniref:hypothetical protein n=1 Tax=Streptomyces dangxiongensis TaxID=1442032 RepID=UPI0013CF3BA4|nr:hypothetical protein [Streptomyces dangxiongensis]
MMSWLGQLNPQVAHVIAAFVGIGLMCLYALLVVLVRKLQGRPVSGLPPRDDQRVVAGSTRPPNSAGE